jgi:hypothetical protein
MAEKISKVLFSVMTLLAFVGRGEDGLFHGEGSDLVCGDPGFAYCHDSFEEVLFVSDFNGCWHTITCSCVCSSVRS